MIRQSSPNEVSNLKEKEKFQNLVMKSAMGLFKNYKRKSKEVQKDSEDFVTFVAKNMDGKTFALFNKYLNELKHDVLGHKTQKVSADSFMIFLDRMRSLTHSESINDIIISKLEKVDVSRLHSKDLLDQYQEHSIDFKFEESLREGEIKAFAQTVTPKARFLFDNYKVQDDVYQTETAAQEPLDSSQQEENDFFSFFGSHEKMITKPETSFRNIKQFLVTLPIDYYILL